MAYKILIPDAISDKGVRFLRERGCEVTMGVDTSVDALVPLIGDYDALLARNIQVPRRLIEAGKKLRVIGRHGTGVDSIDLDAARENGVWVVNAPTGNINAVAEQTVAFLLGLCCQVVPCDRATREGDWSFRNTYHRMDLKGKTLGLIGFGRIGELVARKAGLGLEMEVLAFAPHPKQPPEWVKMADRIEEVLRRADYLSLHIPSTPETRGLMNRETFGMMKRGSFFVNCSRGDLYDEDDLCEALKNGQLAGAALDVYSEEPMPAGRELLKLPNILFSQHCAAHSVESVDAMGYGAALGIHQVLTGREPEFVVVRPEHPRAL